MSLVVLPAGITLVSVLYWSIVTIKNRLPLTLRKIGPVLFITIDSSSPLARDIWTFYLFFAGCRYMCLRHNYSPCCICRYQCVASITLYPLNRTLVVDRAVLSPLGNVSEAGAEFWVLLTLVLDRTLDWCVSHDKSALVIRVFGFHAPLMGGRLVPGTVCGLFFKKFARLGPFHTGSLRFPSSTTTQIFAFLHIHWSYALSSLSKVTSITTSDISSSIRVASGPSVGIPNRASIGLCLVYAWSSSSFSDMWRRQLSRVSVLPAERRILLRGSWSVQMVKRFCSRYDCSINTEDTSARNSRLVVSHAQIRLGSGLRSIYNKFRLSFLAALAAEQV